MNLNSGALLALIAVLCTSFNDSAKKQLADKTSSLATAWFSVSGAALLGWFYFNLTGWPPIEWSTTLCWLLPCAAMMVFCELTFVSSLRGNDFSLAIPFKTSNVLFAALLSWLLLGEASSPVAITGMLLIVSGGYLLLWKSESHAWWMPLRSMFSEPGPRLMLASNLMFSFLSCFQKEAALASSPIFFLWAMILIEFAFFSLMLLRRKIDPVAIFKQEPLLCLRIPIFWAIAVSLLFQAMNISNITVAISIMQLQVLISMFLSHHIFQERDSLKRLPAACIMLAGAVMAVFY